MKNFTLKRIEITEKETVKQLFLSVFTAEPWCDDWSDKNQLDMYITDLMGQINSLSYGLYNGEMLVGISLGRIKHWYTGTEYCIDEFCIKRELQGQGNGTYFIKEIEKAIKDEGLVQIYLQTDNDTPAFDFYRKNGFILLDTTVSLAKEV